MGRFHYLPDPGRGPSSMRPVVALPLDARPLSCPSTGGAMGAYLPMACEPWPLCPVLVAVLPLDGPCAMLWGLCVARRRRGGLWGGLWASVMALCVCGAPWASMRWPRPSP